MSSDKDLQSVQLERIKDISLSVRDAIRDSLPGPADQFLTMMIPGKSLNLQALSSDFGDDGKPKHETPSAPIKLTEAMICDDMPPFAPLQLGPTGRSVARSYAAALSKLCPARSTTGVADSAPLEKLSPSERRYRDAMEWLTLRDPNNNNKTRVDVYREKQDKYAEAFGGKVKEFREALEKINKEHPPEDRGREFQEWVNGHYKTHNNLIQATYMDWVTVGKKEEVEYNFAIVDNDSAMARVEASKESMRLSIIPSVDGIAEYHKVELTPDNWAHYAMKKATRGPKGETVESLMFRISRLEKINIILESMIDDKESTPDEPDTDPANQDDVNVLTKKYLSAQKEFDSLSARCSSAAKAGLEKPGDDDAAPMARLQKAADKLTGSRKLLNQSFEQLDRKNVRQLSMKNREVQKGLINRATDGLQAQINRNKEEIERLQALIVPEGSEKDAAAVQNNVAGKAGLQPDLPSLPSPSPTTAGAGDEGPWTSISFLLSSSYSHTTDESSAWSLKAEATYRSWFNSVNMGLSHEQSHAAALREMANATIRVSFECMRVDITRPWLRPELFLDHDLRVADGDHISPGKKFASLIDKSHPRYKDLDDNQREVELMKYDLFPMYPTAFLVAANVILELEGETSSIQTYLNNSSTSGSVGLNIGSFSVGASVAHSGGDKGFTCRTTGAGCRIAIHYPQVIGWISQIVPELPRPQRRINQ